MGATRRIAWLLCTACTRTRSIPSRTYRLTVSPTWSRRRSISGDRMSAGSSLWVRFADSSQMRKPSLYRSEAWSRMMKPFPSREASRRCTVLL
ncbi:hypothetical protein LJK88_03025 [Paenibacillus sp. P26]|nr:hypothetical protein LJK88_03025 [Paenibacillus sp. P26]